MKKTILSMLVIAAMLLCFVGCATKPVEKISGDWWNNPPADTDQYHYEVGYAKGSNLMTSREWAKANANAALAQYVSNSVDSIVTTYLNDAGELATNNMQSLQAFESVSKQNAKAIIAGVTFQYTEKDDGVYVLAKMPIKDFAEILKTTFAENQQTFQTNAAAIEATDKMNAAIDKYFGRN